ncbi:MAG: alpha/beta fold hydrolase [Gaiellales bacterium]
MRRLASLLIVLCALLGPSTAAALTPTQLRALGADTCPNVDSVFRCLAVTVPLDHFDPANHATLKVLVGVHPAATSHSKGLLVTAVGGPGASGLSDADALLGMWSPAIVRQYDIVYFDQRGIAASSGIYCPQAVLAARRAEGTARFDLAITDARFTRECVRELDAPALLAYLDTRQAAEDLEAIRQALGAERMSLYGTSYGTQLAAAYARQHPEGLRSLILDGVVDTSLSATGFWASAARGFESVLNETLGVCGRRPACRRDMPQGARVVYDQLNARLARQPIRVTRGTGLLTQTMLHTYIGSSLYSAVGRATVLRDLARAARGDYDSLAEGAWIAEGVDPSTWTLLNTGLSYASYFGVQCRDAAYYAGTPSERAAQWTTAGAALGAQLPRIGQSIFEIDLSCAWWPNPPALTAPPSPLVAAGIPTIVLTATGDPITPHAQGDAVFRSLAEGHLIRTIGAGHVTLSRDAPCSYAPVEQLLLRDRLPAAPRTTCPGRFVAPY